jgi:hypothetical protein
MGIHGANIARDRKIMAGRMYQKMIQVLNKTELEHFDVCKDYISKQILEDEIKQNQQRRSA